MLLAGFCPAAKSQLSLSATIGPQIPVGDFGKVFNVGFGFTATGRYLLTENVAVGLNLGYTGFGVKDLDGYKASMVPVTGLFEYHYRIGKLRPYAGIDMGLCRYAISVKSGAVKETSGKTYFALAPSLGTSYLLTDKCSLLANLKFNRVFADKGVSWIGLNLGAAYSL